MSGVRITPDEMVIVGARRSLGRHISEIWAFRELLWGLTRKELKIRYKNSALGFVWSMVQPVFLLLIYSIAFSILGAGFKRFAIWLLCGLLVWNFVTTSLQTSVQAITANGYLVSKVRFPRAILPLSTVGAAALHFLLQLSAFAIVLAVMRHPVDWGYVPLVVPAALATLLFCSALSLLLSSLNVKSRDTQHLLDLAMLGWFWLSPIIYPYARAATSFARRGLPGSIGLFNPVTPILITFQRALYGVSNVLVDPANPTGPRQQLLPDESQWWYLRNIGIIAVVSLALMAYALNVFDRAEANFAEDL